MTKRALLIMTFILLSVAALNLPVESATSNSAGVCETCEENCYRDAENVHDYNNCIRVVCNYGLGCWLPIIQ